MVPGISEIVMSIIVVLIVFYSFYRIAKKAAYNTIVGLILLFLMNLTIFRENPIPLKILTITIVALSGVIGAVLLAGLHYLGIYY